MFSHLSDPIRQIQVQAHAQAQAQALAQGTVRGTGTGTGTSTGTGTGTGSAHTQHDPPSWGVVVLGTDMNNSNLKNQ
jgi:hypothetical protein